MEGIESPSISPPDRPASETENEFLPDQKNSHDRNLASTIATTIQEPTKICLPVRRLPIIPGQVRPGAIVAAVK